MKDELIVWRLVHDKIVTLKELNEDYTLDDVYKLLSFHKFSNHVEDLIKKNIEHSSKIKSGKK